MRLTEVWPMCWWEVLHHFVQWGLGLRRFAASELTWNFRYVHHRAGCSHTYRQHRCPRRSHGVRMKHRLIGWISLSFFLFSFALQHCLGCTFPRSSIASLYMYRYFHFNHARLLGGPNYFPELANNRLPSKGFFFYCSSPCGGRRKLNPGHA